MGRLRAKNSRLGIPTGEHTASNQRCLGTLVVALPCRQPDTPLGLLISIELLRPAPVTSLWPPLYMHGAALLKYKLAVHSGGVAESEHGKATVAQIYTYKPFVLEVEDSHFWH